MQLSTFKKPLLYLLVGVFLFTPFSCENFEETDPITASLEVTVRGTISGKLRENIKVNVYNSKEDADNRNDPVKEELITDSQGIATFTELKVGNHYWIRADANLSWKLDDIESLKEGMNAIEIRLL